MVIKGVKQTKHKKYFANRNVKLKRKDDSQVIKAISTNESAFVRKNIDKFVFPTVTIDSVRITKADKQEVETMLNDISNNSNVDFIEECLAVLAEGEEHTGLVQNKIDNMIKKIKTKKKDPNQAEIMPEIEAKLEEKTEKPVAAIQQEVNDGVIDFLENQIPEKPKELKIKERNPLDVVYDGMEDDINAKTVEHMDNLTSYEVSYV